jgi:hypothetical protein
MVGEHGKTITRHAFLIPLYQAAVSFDLTFANERNDLGVVDGVSLYIVEKGILNSKQPVFKKRGQASFWEKDGFKDIE